VSRTSGFHCGVYVCVFVRKLVRGDWYVYLLLIFRFTTFALVNHLCGAVESVDFLTTDFSKAWLNIPHLPVILTKHLKEKIDITHL